VNSIKIVRKIKNEDVFFESFKCQKVRKEKEKEIVLRTIANLFS
jgi:hypothetical protein